MNKIFTTFAVMAAAFAGTVSAQTIFDTPEIQYMVMSIEPATVQTYQELDWMGMSGWYNYGHAKGDVVVPETVDYNGRSYTVVRIGAESFYWHEFMTSIEIPGTVTSIGQNAFRGMNRSILKSVDIKGCEVIEKEAFSGNIALEQVTFPSNLLSIGEKAFQNCTLLETLVFPEGLSEIAPLAFSGCTYIGEVYNYATEPQVISGVIYDDETEVEFDYDTNPVFYGVNVKKIDLYVPHGCVEAYQNADVWKDFNIIEMPSTGISEISDAESNIDVYDMMGRVIARNVAKGDLNSLNVKGVYVIKQGSSSKKVILK